MDRFLKLAAILFLAGFMSLPAITPYLPFFGGNDTQIVTDWARRVVANGGALPSQTSIIAMETLRSSLVTLGLTNKIWTLCVFVPDSVIAASTPLIKNKGSDPWSNSGFVAGDLNINGLKGNFANFLDTGVIASSVQTNNNNITTNVGITAIVTESATNAAQAIVLQQIFLPGNNGIGLFASGAGTSQFYAGAVASANDITTNDFNRVGYISGQRLFSTNALFVASPVESHKLLATNVASASTLVQFNSTFTFFGTRIQNTNNIACGLRLSMGCLHEGFTQTESSNFWWAVKTCREALGGGTGDPIHDWARYVTNFGGAAVSVNTSNSLRTFRQGLDTDGLLYKMVAVNPVVPDNLTAARLPVVWQTGFQIWSNSNFGESNLTVNGLTGNRVNKYLSTGLNLVAFNYAGFGNSNAGVSLLIQNVPTSTNVHDFSATGSGAGSIFALAQQSGELSFYAWRFVNVNSNFLTRVLPTTTTPGYFSGNRTASNAIALFWVTNQVHNIATNSTTTQTGATLTLTNIAMFANLPAGGVPGAFSDRTLSFAAIHAGLTQTESSNLWYRVATLRTNLGGGVP